MNARGAKVERVCKCGCGIKFMARTADVARGWGKYASKSCKARVQEKRTGQYSAYRHRAQNESPIDDPHQFGLPGRVYETEQDYFSDNATGDHDDRH